jgi:hypothetical protein
MMNWNKLYENKCPKCGSMLDPQTAYGKFWCSGSFCTFSITPERLAELTGIEDADYKIKKHRESLSNLNKGE